VLVEGGQTDAEDADLAQRQCLSRLPPRAVRSVAMARDMG